MSIVHSYAVGNGDMFSIRHNSDNCTIIDCSILDCNQDKLFTMIDSQRTGKGITRFISTHPDQDHLTGLVKLDNHINILNFYVVQNSARKECETEDFKHYKCLRDSGKAFYINKDLDVRWLNVDSEERGSSGITFLWPIATNKYFRKALADAHDGKSPNNISPVIMYSVEEGVKMAWFGDLETEFMENIEDAVRWPTVDILFAPHHGRASGKIPRSILKIMDPKIVVIGEAPSENLNYYSEFNTITQNSAGSIYFQCVANWVHIYVDSLTYNVNFLIDIMANSYGNYIGSLKV